MGTRTAALAAIAAAGAIALAGCSGSSDPAPTPTATQTTIAPGTGLQTYGSVQDLYAAMMASGVSCSGLHVDQQPEFAEAQGRCNVPDSTHQIVIALYSSPQERDEHATVIVNSTGGRVLVGGNWMVETDSDAQLVQIRGQLGGKYVTGAAS